MFWLVVGLGFFLENTQQKYQEDKVLRRNEQSFRKLRSFRHLNLIVNLFKLIKNIVNIQADGREW